MAASMGWLRCVPHRLMLLVLALPACAEASSKPEQLHIAFAGRDASGAPTGMRVAWFTHDRPAASSLVKYGLKSRALDKTVPEEGSPREYIKGFGFHHVAPLLGLKPDTRYYYAVGNDEDGWSDEWSFTTAPSGRAAARRKISVSVFGDMGWEDSAQRPMEIHVDGLVRNWSATVTRRRLEAMKGSFDMVWHLGDIAYADDAFAHKLLGFTYEECYNGWMNWMQNLSATMPYMVSVGNHESECHSAACYVSERGTALKNFTAYNARWHMPSAESSGVMSMWYSWNYGPVHFVSVNTETDFPNAEEKDTGDSHSRRFPAGHFAPDGAYLKWLEADLKAASEARKAGKGPRWIVAGGHRPYGDITKEHVPLFEKYGVDLYVAGHGHAYVRGTPVNGTTYVMVGGAGCDEMAAPSGLNDTCSYSDGACSGMFAPGFAVAHGSEVYQTSRFATGILQADHHSLSWELVDSETGKVLDSTSIGSPMTAFV
mmetsp:Transcript_4421/g.12067  ORF Transcript_4421/g.12067 Transcript_4421/m.12067 type:complete len:485 (-) Transcript_4421:91-1545(-)